MSEGNWFLHVVLRSGLTRSLRCVDQAEAEAVIGTVRTAMVDGISVVSFGHQGNAHTVYSTPDITCAWIEPA